MQVVLCVHGSNVKVFRVAELYSCNFPLPLTKRCTRQLLPLRTRPTDNLFKYVVHKVVKFPGLIIYYFRFLHSI